MVGDVGGSIGQDRTDRVRSRLSHAQDGRGSRPPPQRHWALGLFRRWVLVLDEGIRGSAGGRQSRLVSRVPLPVCRPTYPVALGLTLPSTVLSVCRPRLRLCLSPLSLRLCL